MVTFPLETEDFNNQKSEKETIELLKGLALKGEDPIITILQAMRSLLFECTLKQATRNKMLAMEGKLLNNINKSRYLCKN